jgi:prepilin-type N-terminal cleavage/methylation domain-containing protein
MTVPSTFRSAKKEMSCKISHSAAVREVWADSLRSRSGGRCRGFSLIELLVVMAIIAILAAVAGPAFSAFKGSGGLSKAAFDISNTMQLARAYAMSKNTYVYVGLQEVDAIVPTSADGVGRLVVAAVASKSGVRATDFTTGVVPISKAQTLDGATLTNAAATTASPGFQFTWPIGGTTRYTFKKVIEFDPQGVARVQKGATGTSSIEPSIEIGLAPARGNTALASDPNWANIKITGITGATQILRP